MPEAGLEPARTQARAPTPIEVSMSGVSPGPIQAWKALMTSLRWKNRVIVVFAPPGHAALEATREALARDPEGLADRRLLVYEVVEGESVEGMAVAAADVRTEYTVPAGRFTAVLLGLDGLEKARTHDAVDLAAWYAKIDAMPMRRLELESRSRGER